MLLSYKIIKVTFQRTLNRYRSLLNGRWCFVCVTFFMVLTLLVLRVRIDLASRRNSAPNMLIKAQRSIASHKAFYSTTKSTRKVTKSFSEMMKSVPEINADILFLNSVPESGGELLVLLLQWLQHINGFRHVRLPAVKKLKLPRYEQEKVVELVMGEVKNGAIPFTFDLQVRFINFTSFGFQSPTLFSIIRHPIDKAIARFHYHQATPMPYFESRLNFQGTVIQSTSNLRSVIVKGFEECVRNNEPICTYQDGKKYQLTIPYFCGHDEACLIHNSKWALNRAKQNVERYYSVVGLLEDVNATLNKLQHRVPNFFNGATKLYNTHLSEKKVTRKLHHKSSHTLLSKEVIKILEHQLSMEYDFYYFIKNRLQQEHLLGFK